MLKEDRVAAHLGITLIDCNPGTATVAMTVTDLMTNGHGITHGGFAFTLANTAFALACNSYGETTVAAAAGIDFLTPTTVGDELTAVAVEKVRRGRSGIYDVTVLCREEVVAEFRGNSRQVRRS